MEVKKLSNVQSFSQVQVENETVYACRWCYVDIFLETNILFYVSRDNAFFVKQRESINFTPGHYTRINCSNCKKYLGRVVYHFHTEDNELRLTGVVPKYTFR